jgi:hypothetical protein
MAVPKRNPDPKTLAESLGAQGSPCPIPFTHDRLSEAHHWWHEMAHYYHEPEPFRYRLGAFVVAARSVTYMLQKESSKFEDFGWYDEWVLRAKDDKFLRWLNDVRTDFIHRQALEPKSYLKMRCIDNPRERHFDDDEDEEGSNLYNVSPFACTHYYIGIGWRTDHAHEFTRHWEMEGLACEVLEACATVYDRLDEVVTEAHKRLGADHQSFRKSPAGHSMPCMDDTTKFRVICTTVKDGKEVWEYEPPGLHEH